MTKRIISFILCVLLAVQAPIVAFADTPGISGGADSIPVPGSPGTGKEYGAAVWNDWGFRVTMTTAKPIIESGIQKLSGNYSIGDVEDQRNRVENILVNRYWEPGDFGIYFYGNRNQGAPVPALAIATTQPGEGYNIANTVATMQSKESVDQYYNRLAWTCWLNPEVQNRGSNVPPYSEMLYNILVGNGVDYANGDDWIYHVMTNYYALAGETDDSFKERMRNVIGTGPDTANNIRNFSWDTTLNGGTAQQQVFWSFVGHLTMCIQFAWYAKQTGNQKTYESMRDILYAYYVSDYDADLMPVLEIEACSNVTVTGRSTWDRNNSMLTTLPYQLNEEYGTDSSPQLFAEWPEGINSTEDMVRTIAGAKTVASGGTLRLGQGLGYVYNGGRKVISGADRKFYELLKPTEKNLNNVGYLVAFCYYVDNPGGTPTGGGGPDGSTAKGSFTWDLKPKGVIDKTPAKEINESSTIYNLNISQAGYNHNNYAQWETWVRSDSENCNKIRINIYHVAESLPKDKKSTVYTYGQVKSTGKPVTTPLDRVTPGDGIIGGLPPGVSKVIKNGEEVTVSDDELLTLLKTGTGLTYTENIGGPVDPDGIRVTYEIYIDVKVGCNKGKWEPLSNTQTEFVEYRSEPGTYTWISDDPTGYAEIKCGYFDRDEYTEPYEAMSGLPTTENLYFVSGGQEFVAQIKYEYVTNKDTIRNFEQKYSTQVCEGYFEPWSNTWTDTPTDTIKSWLDTWTTTAIEGKNSKTCSQCGSVHNNSGSSGVEKYTDASYSENYGGTEPKPGGYYSTLNLTGTYWDWSAPAVSVHYEETENGPVPKCSGASAKTVNDTQDPGEPPTCGCGTSSSWSKDRTTRWSGTITFCHRDWNNNSDHKDNTASIKFQQQYQHMNYAKIKDVHVWRLEKSRVEGIKQMTFANEDAIVAEADEFANAIFNVAEADTAKEGRMYYILHPEDHDDFKFKATLPTRGCCHCFNHNAAEDLIKQNEGYVANGGTPAKTTEQAWCISDYLILEGINDTTSLLYYEYETKNRTIPILNIQVSGTDPESRKDNGYTVIRETEQPEFRGYDKRGQSFKTQNVLYDTANLTDGTEEKICQNYETFYGGNVDSDDLDWGGYNGTGGSPRSTADSNLPPDEVDKYKGKGGKNNWRGTGDKKIFKTGYTHNHQGEVNGYSTSSPQKMANNDQPFVLCYNDIDVHDVKVHNGKYSFKNSTIFYKNIISYAANQGTGGGSTLWSESNDSVYGQPGFHKKTNYSNSMGGINSIVIHNPVSAQYARLIPLPEDLDQRTEENPLIDQMNEDTGVCPGKSNACKYSHINCQYNGSKYHTEDCYAKTRGTGLASIGVEGSSQIILKPITVYETQQGSTSFGHTGGVQEFTAPTDGTYVIETWGAQGGGSSSYSGGLGGYAKGSITLKAGQKLYVFVGGAGSKYSGGYNGGGGANTYYGGGGATFVSTENKGLSSGYSVYYNGGETGWKCTDGQFHSVVFDPGNSGSFTLYKDHKYELRIHKSSCTYGGSTYYRNGWFHLYDVTAGDCLSCPHGCGFLSSPRYTLDINANPLNQNGFQGFVQNTGIKIVAGGGGGAAHTASGTAGGSSTSSSIGNMQGGYGSRHGGGGGGGAVGGSGGSGGCSTYGTGGTNYVGGVTNTTSKSGVQSGNGKCVISYNIQVPKTVYVPEATGSYKYDPSQGTVFAPTLKPQIYTAPTAGYYSVHLYGGAGGGADKGKPSARGYGGYAAGQIYLRAGQQVLVTVGGQGLIGNAGTQYSGGYNGGGHAQNGSTGYGGGGATDIATKFEYRNAQQILANSSGGSLKNGSVALSGSGFYWGPRMTSVAGHVYRVDYYGTNLDKAVYDSLAYTKNWNSNTHNNATLLHSYITPTHVQLFWRVNTASISTGQEFRCLANNNSITLTECYVVDMNDRLMVAAGGAGADNAGGVLNGNDDGTGGDGGGVNGGNGKTDGVVSSNNPGASASSGYGQGYGQSVTAAGDGGAGGAGWYGGYAACKNASNGNNSGGGGGSSKVSSMQNGETKAGQNGGPGYAVFVLPGKGETEEILTLSCQEPHHAPNSNWHYYTAGWRHADGYVCNGAQGCVHCANNSKLYSPSGAEFYPRDINGNNFYIVKHDGEYHITKGTDNGCDTCGEAFTPDKYTLDGKNSMNCMWRVTTYDAACYNTKGSTVAEYHYPFGDDMCYDPCLNDDNHKVKHDEALLQPQERAGQFVVLDYDFDVYFPNIGDFYGNNAFGIKNCQNPEGWSYHDDMDTTIWLKEKYCQFPFAVTYNGKTYLAGEKVMLGTYDEDTYTWTDDQPDTYTYRMHVLLSNSEAALANVRFVAVAKNTPTSLLENTQEDHNYTRYGNNIRAFHDAYKEYYIDVIGRIGVLSIEDTGDFRFSNYYKQVTDGWKVDQVVRNVDLGKQNFVSVDQKTIFDDQVSADTKGQNTWGKTDWMEDVAKLEDFPLTPGKNNVLALKNQAHRIGYSDYMSLVTVGNYYGENTKASNNMYKVQIQPYYYYYNLNTKEWTPVDVYIKDGYEYKCINRYGDKTSSVADYNFNYNLDWEAENERRMYTAEERDATMLVQDNYYTLWDDTYAQANINIPHGLKYLHGTAHMLFLRDGNRTFIGSRTRYGKNTEQDGRVSEVKFNRQAQRWHFTLGLPSTAKFVKHGEACTPENIAKYDMENGVIICALDILAKGQVWTLEYDGTPVGERSFYLFDNNNTLISWENAGANGPEDKRVVVVYTDAKTSRDDLSSEGTH